MSEKSRGRTAMRAAVSAAPSPSEPFHHHVGEADRKRQSLDLDPVARRDPELTGQDRRGLAGRPDLDRGGSHQQADAERDRAYHPENQAQ